MLAIISFSETNIASIVDWASEIVSGVMPLMVVIIGIAIGAYIIKVVLNLRN